MAEKNCEDGDYLEAYSRFFNEFVARINPNDQLPVQASSRTVTEYELDGEIIHVALQYLDQKHCPPPLQGPLVRKIIEEVKAVCKKQPEDCGYKPQERTYAPLKLMQAVTNKVNEVCTYYSDNSNLTSLPPPVSSLLPVISGAMKNSRRTMEDRHVILHDLNTIFSIQHNSPASYYAVFDGHAGHEAATYCATHLHQYLVESCFYPNDPERALHDAFITTEKRLKERSENQKIKSGTTAVCTLLINKKLYIAWAGDSKAELVTYDRYQSLVVPHLAENRDEFMRLRKMGGIVVKGRVNGILSVTRAIGDFALKPYVTAEPEIECIDLDGTEDFLILGSDGFWDFVTIQETAGIIYFAVREGQDLNNLTKSLLPTGSSDNTTVIVVFLTPPSEIAARENFTFPFLKSQEDLQPYLSLSRTNRYWLDEERVKLLELKARMELDRIDMMKVGEDDNKYLVNNPFYENGVRMEDDKDYCGNGRQKNMINIRNNDAQDWEEDEEDIKAICSDLPETDVDAFEPIWTSDVNQTPSSKDIYFGNNDGFSDQRLPHDQNQMHNLNENKNNDDDDDEDDEDYADEQMKKEKNNELIEQENMHQQREQCEKEEQQRVTNIIDDSPPSPHNTKSNQHALISESDNVGDSEDSEDEWNYYRIDPNKEEKECPPTALNETGDKKEIESDTPIESSPVNAEKDSGSEKLEFADQSKELGQCKNPEYQFNFTTSEPEEQKEGPLKLDSDESRIDPHGEDNLIKPTVDSPRVVSPSIEEQKTENAIEDMDFQLNPDAAEFVPVSPPSQSQAPQRVINTMNFHDFPISGSPMKQNPQAVVDNISLPSEKEFEEGARQRPNEIGEKGCSNGDGYVSENDENLPPFATSAGLDESVSEISSTKANFGDESSASILTVTDFHKTGLSMLDDSYTGSDRGEYDIARDPMAMSLTPGDFEAVLDEPKVDLNAVHDLTGPELDDDDDNINDNNDSINEVETRVDSPQLEEQHNEITRAGETSNPFVTSFEEKTVILDHPGDDNTTLSHSAEDKLLESPTEFSKPNDESSLLQFDNPSCDTRDHQFLQETCTEGQNLLSHSPEPITTMECSSSPQPSNVDLATTNLISSMENLTVTDNANMVMDKVFANQSDVVSSSPPDVPEIKYDHQEYSSSYEPHEEKLENDLMSTCGAEEATGNLIEYDSCPSPQLEKDKVIDSPTPSPINTDQKHEEEFVEKQQMEEKAEIVESSEDEFAKTEERVCNLEAAQSETTQNLAATAANLSLNLSESVQEFTGLERELQPSPTIPEVTKSQEEAESVQVCPKESSAEIVQPEEKLSSPETETISQEAEKPKVELASNEVEETKKESAVPETVGVATVAGAAVAAAAVAGAVSSSSVTKTKPKTTTTTSGKSTKPGTTATTKTVSHKSTTPTSPLKAVASSTTRATSQSTVTKRPSTTANRPKQLDTANKPSSVSSTSKAVPSKTAPPTSKVSATKTSTTTRPTSAPTKTRTSVNAAAKPSTGSSTTTQEKKQPTTNGDVKPLSKLTSKPSTASRVSTAGSAATKTTLVKSSTATKTTSSTTGGVTSTIKSRVTSATGATTKSTTTRSTISNTTTSQRPKTAPVVNSNATHHLTATKSKTTTTKSPMIDKQIKETANKQISLAKTSPTKSPRAPISAATKRVSSTNKSATATSTPSPIKKLNSVQAKVSSKVSSSASTKTTTTSSSTTPQVVQNGVSENVETVKNVIPENKEIEDDAPKKDLSPIVAPPDNQLIMSAD